MPWVDQPEPCCHPDRPPPKIRDEDKVWECSDCQERWRVVVVDHGHDIMPGEDQVEAQWWHVDIAPLGSAHSRTR